ncbi:MAG TPA: DUF4397 domain-containing protein [Mucilaginibacter sp.]|jgi:hypothetical protein|nr:DUF4397 domain-containing protein [Mucilaginibacter sp.]
MNKILQIRAGMIGMICLLAVCLSSCLKNTPVPISNEPQIAQLSIINAAPSTQSVDFYLDQTKLNPTALAYGGGLDYINIPTGTKTATFYLTGTQQVVKTSPIYTEPNIHYSLFLSNLLTTPDFLLLADTINNPPNPNNVGLIRFINLSPDAQAVDLGISGTNANLAENKSYKGYSNFVQISGNTVTLQVKKAGTSTVLFSLPNVALQRGGVYTAWLHGFAATTDQTKLTLSIQSNGSF